MKLVVVPSDRKITINNNAVRFTDEEWGTLGIDDHIHAIQYDDALGFYEIEWCMNVISRRQPANDRFPVGQFGKHWTRDEFDLALKKHAEKVAWAKQLEAANAPS